LEFSGSAEIYTKALALCKSLHGNESLMTSKVCYRLAQLYWNQGMWDKSEPHCLESIKIREKILGADHLLVAKCLTGLGEMYIVRDRPKAKAFLERALAIRKRVLGEHHQLVSRILHDLAVIEDFMGNHSEAVRLHQQAIEIREKQLGPEHPELALSWENLGTTYKLCGKFKEAVDAMQKALKINIDVHGEINPAVASCYEWLALIYKDLKSDILSDSMHKKSQNILEKLRLMGVSLVERIVD